MRNFDKKYVLEKGLLPLGLSRQPYIVSLYRLFVEEKRDYARLYALKFAGEKRNQFQTHISAVKRSPYNISEFKRHSSQSFSN